MAELIRLAAANEAEPQRLPRNIEAEAAFLGAILIDNRVIEDVSIKLQPDHFFEPLHGRIYEQILRLIDRNMLVTPVTLKDIQDVFELRLLLEPPAARLAAGRVDAKRLRVLDEICRAGYQSDEPKSIARFLEANKEFHVAIAQAAGNTRLVNSIDQLLDEMTRLLHLGLGSRNRSQEMQHEHRILLRALVRGDGTTAEQICREQIEAARDMVLKAIMNSSALMNFAITADA